MYINTFIIHFVNEFVKCHVKIWDTASRIPKKDSECRLGRKMPAAILLYTDVCVLSRKYLTILANFFPPWYNIFIKYYKELS